MVEFITLTQDNIHWALSENFRRAYEELKYKVPVNGTAVLQGDADFKGTGTILNVVPLGPNSAVPNSYNGEINEHS